MNAAHDANKSAGQRVAAPASLRAYYQAYLRGLKVISRGGQGPRLGCTGLLFAGLFLGMSLMFSFFTGNRVYLECIRENAGPVDCLIQTRWFGLVLVNEILAENVQSATLDVFCDDGDCSYRVLLVTASGDIPLTEFFNANQAPKESAIQAIERFLADPQADRLALKVGSTAEVGAANLLPLILFVLSLLFGYFSLQSIRPPSSSS
jgi:hypothetical protein